MSAPLDALFTYQCDGLDAIYRHVLDGRLTPVTVSPPKPKRKQLAPVDTPPALRASARGARKLA